MQSLELIVFVSTLIIALLSGILAAFLTKEWGKSRQKSLAFWSTGLWIFTIAVLFESLFSLSYYSEALIDTYLFLVVVLVEFLATGSLYLLKNKAIKCAYIIYALFIDVALVLAFQYSTVSGIIVNYVVYGVLPLPVVIVSAMGTFPAAIILIVVAALSYRKSRNMKMLSIIAGTLVVSIAGTLYIAAMPEFLYYSEFIGILLLWFGFFSFRDKRSAHVKQHMRKNMHKSTRKKYSRMDHNKTGKAHAKKKSRRRN